MTKEVIVIGGGLAGSEAAWQVAKRGVDVVLYEMRPLKQTGAHQSGYLAELVCSNSLGSRLPDRASGVLMTELRRLESLLLSIAEREAVPAGGALAVDREAFARGVTEQIDTQPHITLIREEVSRIPDGIVIVASGPLTSDKLANELSRITGEEHLYFFDALSPIVETKSIDMSVSFRASRYGRGQIAEGDYINCPMNEVEYEAFIDALLGAEKIPLHDFEVAVKAGVRAGPHVYFEGCLPVEVIAERGRKSLAYGPMRPVGLIDPRSGKRPYAVVQLRQDNLIGNLYNIVGFQTNLTYCEQDRVFSMIPGLEEVKFIRYGQMHRNTFINAPRLLLPTLQFCKRPSIIFAGQITGVEGYLGNIATGLYAGWSAARLAHGYDPIILPQTTMLGSLCHYISHADPKSFQPMKANFGIITPLDDDTRRNRRQRAKAYANRSSNDLALFLDEYNF
ncbi:MAG: methylenetetrahydrofolate--tRNA-(uracil(54)-C(5))-methyltransferase (FADH(2)-oxidizing) TrmFO [Anaerolineales bacterium]|nr:MAG: methylenetetrahydrofolate--tRNA-(uracil(54)-C(5))-methyltransferase (FADH(2)-oxidizing) TrmFO [Anaerolineales bacterium]